MLRKALYAAAVALLAVVVAVLLASSVVPRAMGAVPLTVLTGSMQPALNPGDLAVVKPIEDPGTIRIGEVISFRPESGSELLVTHRVVATSVLGTGEIQLITKGDANEAADAPIEGAQAVGRFAYRVPFVGHVANRVPEETRAQLTQAAGVLLIGTGIISAILTIKRSRKGKQDV